MMRMTEKKTTIRANLIGTVLDIGISLLLGSVIIGKVALPTFYTVVTSSFDPYTLLVWGILPLIGVAAWGVATYNRAKYAYEMSGAGGLG